MIAKIRRILDSILVYLDPQAIDPDLAEKANIRY